MSKKHQEKESESESEFSNIESLDAYIEASEMYSEALKLSGVDIGYVVGTAVCFGKAYLAFVSSDNRDAIKKSLREAINAYLVAITFCETNGIGKQFVGTSELIIATMRIELQNM